MGKKIDLVGEVYGKLTVLKDTGKRGKSGFVIWECQCDCGNIREVYSNALSSGNSKSCGCSRIKHGHTHYNKKNSRT